MNTVETLVSKGFRPHGAKGKVKSQDYTNVYDTLAINKKLELEKGSKKVVLSFEPNGNAPAHKIIQLFDGDNLVASSVGGELSSSTLDGFVGNE